MVTWRPRCFGVPTTDNFVFELCYRWTACLLVVFSLIVTCRLLFGDSFLCTESSSLSLQYATAICYDHGVYTSLSNLVIMQNESASIDAFSENSRRYSTYYPWVNLQFLMQAFVFYLPHLLWKYYDQGYMCRLTEGVQWSSGKEEVRSRELSYLAKYTLVTQGSHKRYVAVYVFFEACNQVVVLAQTVWLVHFFDVTGVPDHLPYSVVTWSDFADFYFPSEGYCELNTMGPSGDTMYSTSLCQMPMNNLYEKLFLFLHAWYILLTLLCGLVLFYRILLLLPSFRTFVTEMSSPLAQKTVLRSLCGRLSYSDWFFLSRLQKVMTDVDFAQLVDMISLASRGKDAAGDIDRRSSFFEDALKDFDTSNATYPL